MSTTNAGMDAFVHWLLTVAVHALLDSCKASRAGYPEPRDRWVSGPHVPQSTSFTPAHINAFQYKAECVQSDCARFQSDVCGSTVAENYPFSSAS